MARVQSASTKPAPERRKSSLKRSLSQKPMRSTRRCIIQPYAYHGTMLKAHVESRGDGWQQLPVPPASKLSTSQLEKAVFVWYKFEDLDDIPRIPRRNIPSWVCEAKVLNSMNAKLLVEPSDSDPSYSPTINISFGPVKPLGPTMSPRSPDGPKCLQYNTMVFPRNPRFVSCFKNSSGLWKKHLLYQNFKRWCDAAPDVRGSIRERMPVTFTVDLMNQQSIGECRTSLDAMSSFQATWIAKRTGGANGNGIAFGKAGVELLDKLVQDRSAKTNGSKDTDWWVIQEFVERMPLVRGSRFMMKVMTLVVATPIGLDIYAYTRQRLQTCQEPFDPEGFLTHPLMCLTNWVQQKNAKGGKASPADYLVPLPDAIQEIPEMNGIWESALDIIAEAIEACWAYDRSRYDFTVGCFEMYGCDFVVERHPDDPKALRPLLLEFNHRPGYTCSKAFIEQFIRDAIDLVLQPVFPKSNNPSGPWTHARTLVLPQDRSGTPVE
jgi:hypothetical protein